MVDRLLAIGTSSGGHPEVQMRGQCGAGMERVPRLVQHGLTLGEIFDDQ
jgi:hypothetical protein